MAATDLYVSKRDAHNKSVKQAATNPGSGPAINLSREPAGRLNAGAPRPPQTAPECHRQGPEHGPAAHWSSG